MRAASEDCCRRRPRLHNEILASTLLQEDSVIRVKRASDARRATAQHGLARTLVNNMVTGVSEGFGKTLLLVGVGYRAAATGDKLTLSLGFSHPVIFDIPRGLQARRRSMRGF